LALGGLDRVADDDPRGEQHRSQPQGDQHDRHDARREADGEAGDEGDDGHAEQPVAGPLGQLRGACQAPATDQHRVVAGPVVRRGGRGQPTSSAPMSMSTSAGMHSSMALMTAAVCSSLRARLVNGSSPLAPIPMTVPSPSSSSIAWAAHSACSWVTWPPLLSTMPSAMAETIGSTSSPPVVEVSSSVVVVSSSGSLVVVVSSVAASSSPPSRVTRKTMPTISTTATAARPTISPVEGPDRTGWPG